MYTPKNMTVGDVLIERIRSNYVTKRKHSNKQLPGLKVLKDAFPIGYSVSVLNPQNLFLSEWSFQNTKDYFFQDFGKIYAAFLKIHVKIKGKNDLGQSKTIDAIVAIVPGTTEKYNVEVSFYQCNNAGRKWCNYGLRQIKKELTKFINSKWNF